MNNCQLCSKYAPRGKNGPNTEVIYLLRLIYRRVEVLHPVNFATIITAYNGNTGSMVEAPEPQSFQAKFRSFSMDSPPFFCVLTDGR